MATLIQRLFKVRREDIAARPVGGADFFCVLTALFRSRYLLRIAGYVVILAIMATFLYVTRLQMVAGMGDDLDQRT